MALYCVTVTSVTVSNFSCIGIVTGRRLHCSVILSASVTATSAVVLSVGVCRVHKDIFAAAIWSVHTVTYPTQHSPHARVMIGPRSVANKFGEFCVSKLIAFIKAWHTSNHPVTNMRDLNH